MVLICEGDAYRYTFEDGITTERTVLDELKSTQEETDTRIILYCLYSQYYKRTNVLLLLISLLLVLLLPLQTLMTVFVLFSFCFLNLPFFPQEVLAFISSNDVFAARRINMLLLYIFCSEPCNYLYSTWQTKEDNISIISLEQFRRVV